MSLPAYYNKREKSLVEPSVEILDKLATYYGLTLDEIVYYANATPKPVTMEDKTAAEQVKLMA